MHRRAVQVLHARLGLVSNNGALIRSPEYFTAQVQQSLLTDYHTIQEIPYAPDLDAEIFILDEKDAPPRLVLGEDRVVAVGDFTALEASVLRSASKIPREVVGRFVGWNVPIHFFHAVTLTVALGALLSVPLAALRRRG